MTRCYPKAMLASIESDLWSIWETIKRGITVKEWNLGIADVTLEELVGDRCGGAGGGAGAAPVVIRPRVRWLHKPWFVCYQADPCLVEDGGQLYLYYEDVLFGSMKGRLRAGLFDPTAEGHGAAAGDRRGRLGAPMMDLDHHAAYPYVFKHEGAFWCVPDTGEECHVDLYRSGSPLGPWSRHSVLFEGLPARDSTIFYFGDRWWLFANVCAPGDESCQYTDLHVWHGPEPIGPWTSHVRAPVKQDIGSARPAGRPFVVDGVLYRPAQDCGPRYGARIAINRVTTLTPEDFAEEISSYLEPDPDGPYAAGLHTLTRAGGCVMVDGQFQGLTPNLYKTAATVWDKAIHKVRPHEGARM
jgi:hypothetical protein